MKVKIFVFTVLATLIFSTDQPAIAVQGGDPAVGARQVASLLLTDFATNSSCSAAYVNSMIAITAAHCVTQANSEEGELRNTPDGFWVSAPGEDLSIGKEKDRTHVAEIFRRSDYRNIWLPKSGDIRTQKDDIAFLVLEKEVKGIPPVAFASVQEVAQLKQTGGEIFHIGYGLQSTNSVDGKPYSVRLLAHHLGSARYSNSPALDSHTITSNETGSKAICPGDSGSPWYSTFSGVEKLVAVTVGGSGCGAGTGVNGALGTVVAQYLDLFDAANAAASRMKQEATSRESKAQLAKLAALSKKTYKNCSELRVNFKFGIAKNQLLANAISASNPPFVSSAGYLKNRKLDKDLDGVICAIWPKG